MREKLDPWAGITRQPSRRGTLPGYRDSDGSAARGKRLVRDGCGAADNEYMNSFARDTFGALLEGGTGW